MGPSLSLRDHASFIRPSTRERPATRDQGEHSLVVPSRTSSLHSRITQPIPSTLNVKSSQRTPKTLTHAYMVCGVSREPSLWVKAPPPSQGKIAHRKGAVPQFWLPEILGSSPKLEQDPEIARALHTAMRVRSLSPLPFYFCFVSTFLTLLRLAFLMMSRSVLLKPTRHVFTTPLCSSRTLLILCMGLLFKFGPERMESVPRP